MTIGTAKPTQDEQQQVSHYFIDSHSIQNELTAAQFAREASELIANSSADQFIVTGGSGMYLDALTDGLDDLPHDPAIREELNRELEQKGIHSLVEELKIKDPEYAAQCDLQNPVRVIRALTVIRSSQKTYSSHLNKKASPPFHVIRFIIDIPRELLYDRINERVDQMIKNGLLQEAENLISTKNKLVLNTVGYKEFVPYFKKEVSLEAAISEVKKNSRRYAKRQVTWFNRYNDAYLIPFGSTEKMTGLVLEKLRAPRN